MMTAILLSIGDHMLAGHLTARRQIQLIEISEPSLPPADECPGQILFQPEVTCLCGSDLPFFDGDFEGHPIAYPQPVGMSLHEMVGTVMASNGQRWKAGDRVLAVPEGQCGLFERFVLSEKRTVALAPGLPDELTLLAQPFGTVLHALKKLPNMIDRDVVVLGQGPIGQMFNAGLRNLGARRIIGVDPDPERLKLSPCMGTTATICNRGRDTGEAVTNLLDGSLPDVVIEAVGHKAQALNDAIALVKSDGLILLFGVPPHRIDDVDMRAAMWKNLTIRNSIHPDYERTFPLAMQWIAEGRVNLSPLITHRFVLADIQKAFDVFRDRTQGASKVVVYFPAAGRDA
jgi:threonine dehydrogenase-like Zn-dependent dehydrogenase